MPSVLILATIMLYSAATAACYLQLVGRVSRIAFRFIAIGFFAISIFAVVLHAILLHRWIDIAAGQNLSFFNLFSFAVWLISAIILLLALFKPLRNLAILVFPFSA